MDISDILLLSGTDERSNGEVGWALRVVTLDEGGPRGLWTSGTSLWRSGGQGERMQGRRRMLRTEDGALRKVQKTVRHVREQQAGPCGPARSFRARGDQGWR